MNNINVFGRSNFPFSSETLDFLQKMVQLAARCIDLGGDTYILSGCEEAGTNVNPGYVVIDGEILPFGGGTKQTTVYIKETKRSVTAYEYNYPEAYTSRFLEFGVGDSQKNWSDFKRVETNLSLVNKLAEINTTIEGLKAEAPGTVKMWAGKAEKIPDGYRLCDGSSLLVAQYTKLFDNLGTLHGGDGTTFNLPDLRNRFVVGYNPTDPDYNIIGKKGGYKEITLTTDQIPAHNHIIGTKQEGEADSGSGARDASVGNHNDTNPWGTKNTNSVGGGQAHENRPPFYVLAYIIKV